MPAGHPESVSPVVPAFATAGRAASAGVRVGAGEVQALEGRSWKPSGLLEWFAIGQTLLPALLFVPGSQPFRGAIRASAFLSSLLALAVWYFRRSKPRARHPACRWLTGVLVILAVMIFHPDTDNLVAGVGQIALYAAVFSPLFWVPAFVTSRRQLTRILVILLLCNGLNSVVGVLQVYDPERWMPSEFSSTFTVNRDILAGSTYLGPGGRRIVRPPGLYDTPGAVCGAGTVAALLGLIFSLERMHWWKRAGALGLSAAGMAAIYLSHVRASAVVGIGMITTYLAMILYQRQQKRAASFMALSIGVAIGALLAASMLGGQTIQARFLSLFQGDPREVYYESRGVQLEHAFSDLLQEYPFGAGLARWGVMTNYAGRTGARQMWAEIQPAAWILDGGVLLLVLYTIALVSTVRWQLRLVSRLGDPTDRAWAAAIAAANIGTLALVVTFVPFATQLGLQFWFLEGLLFGTLAPRLQST